MRVTSIGLYSDDVEVVSFQLRKESAQSRYMVRSIQGLDSDEITPMFYGFSASGARFYDFSMKPRTVVILVALNPTFALNEEYSSVRDELYKAISSTRTGEISLRFYSGGATVAKLYGFITKLEAGYFNKNPEAQLTIQCNDPLFRALNPVELEESDIPTSNPLLIADSISTAPHGFKMLLDVNAQVDTFEINDPNGEWTFKVTPNTPFAAGDRIIFSSNRADKLICVDRGALGTTVEHLMNSIHSDSIWPVLFPGRNEFELANRPDVTVTHVDYYPAYWGV